MTSYNTAKRIVQKIVDHGHTAYFAGGWVRDQQMGHPSDDIDIATDATSEQIVKLFPKTIPVGVQFGIVIVVEDNHQFEVATFREEEGYLDGRKPTIIRPTTAQKDARRRDFTINGMFFDPLTETLFDFVSGIEDINMGVIRAIGDAHERFLEDRLRMIRAIRYASRFNFSIAPDTIKAILYHANELFPSVSVERVWQELLKMAKFPHFDESLINLHRFNLLQVIFPSLKDLDIDVIINRVSLIASMPNTIPVIFQILELFPHATLEEKIEIANFFRLSNEEKSLIEHLDIIQKESNQSLSFWARIYAKKANELCLQFLQIKDPSLHAIHEKRVNKLSTHIDRIQSNKPIIKASHLIKLGIKPGPKMGKILQKAEEICIEKNLLDENAILKELGF